MAIASAFKPRIKTAGDFLQAGRALPAWLCGLAFLGVSLGAPQVLAMGAAGARYGLQAALFFGMGAIPAMLFSGLFMMPIYYGSKARSVPEFLSLRFDEKTRVLNACLFAVMTVLSSAISMYVLARLVLALHLLDQPFYALGSGEQGILLGSVVLSALLVLVIVLLGGLTGAIYNQALQFILLIAGFLPLAVLSLKNIGGWNGLKAALPPDQMHMWKGVLHAGTNPMGLNMIGIGVGLGLVLGAGYWCTDFRVLQIAMAAKDASAARYAPLIAAAPAVLLPFLIILPGLASIALPTPHTSTMVREEGGMIYHDTNVIPKEVEAGRGLVPAKVDAASGRILRDAAGRPLLNYDLATPNMLVHFLPTGLLGLGIAALMASFVSGMAGNVTAFNTVFTCDLYQPFLRTGASDAHYLAVARWTTVGGVLLSVGVAVAFLRLHSIMGVLLLAFAVVNAPLLATLLLGMFWKRATGHGAFAGLIAGAAAGLLYNGLSLPADAGSGFHGGWIAVLFHNPTDLAQSVWTAIFAFCASLVAVVAISLFTAPRSASELKGLVFSRPRGASWKQPAVLSAMILLLALALNIFLY